MSLRFQIRFLSHWRTGTGRGRAGSLDATCLRDEVGLPYLPGKHLRGLLRDAVTLAHKCERTTLSAEALFGTRPAPKQDRENAQHQQETTAGMLRVGNARLPSGDRASLLGREAQLAPFLFAVRRATAIEEGSGTALPKSLRMEEVAVPVTLLAELTAPSQTGDGWQDDIRVALPLIRSAGAGRTRGLGRCIVTEVVDAGGTDA
ncbi:MAG TPA: hypothetical protein ENJ52_11625 [Aliiroseovarius sp.]|nr:hypothetical protein [Aliiroseovarius sp.]